MWVVTKLHVLCVCLQHNPPRLLSFIRSFHDDMKGTVVFDGSTSDAFNIKSEVKQGCVLAPTLFGIFFSLVLRHAFCSATEGIYLRTRSDQSSLTSPDKFQGPAKMSA